MEVGTVFGAGCLGSNSSGWHDVLAVGCVPVASGGVDPASPVYPKACGQLVDEFSCSPCLF